MDLPLKYVIRTNKTTTIWGFLMGFGIASYIFCGVFLFSGSKSMEDYAGPCFIIGSILVIASLIVQNAGNMSLVFQRNSFGQAEVVVSDKKQELLRIESPFLIRKYVQEEPTGARGPARTMPSIYVVFVDKSENILLTLKMNMGLAPIQPDFMEVPLGTVQGNPIFTCSKLRQINAVLNELALEPLQQNATPV